MNKVSKRFQTTYTKFKRVYKGNNKWGNGPALIKLQVEGVAYCDHSVSCLDDEEKYSVDIETIEHPGYTTLELIEAGVDLDDVIDYCTREASLLFTQETYAA